MRDFRKLNVWEKSHKLALDIYPLTASFPKEEVYGLTSQIRRSGVSIPSNIAEGCGRGSPAELAHFCRIALGSASELEYQLQLAMDLDYLKTEDYMRVSTQIEEIKKMLTVFVQKVNASR